MSSENVFKNPLAVEYTQPPLGDSLTVQNVPTTKLPPHPFSSPMTAARARYNGFTSYVNEKTGLSVAIDEEQLTVRTKDREARATSVQTVWVAGSVAILSDTDASLYINEEPSTVAAARNLIELACVPSATNTELRDTMRRSKGLRNISRAALVEASLIPAELLPFIIGTGPAEISILAGAMGVVTVFGDFLAFVIRNSSYLPYKYGRMAITLPEYVRNSATVKLHSKLPGNYIYDTDKKYLPLLSQDDKEYLSHFITPKKLITGILRNTTDPVGTWAMIRTDVIELGRTTAGLEIANQDAEIAHKLAGTNDEIYRRSAEKETLDAAQASTLAQMKAIADKMLPIITPQIFERQRVKLSEEALALLDLKDIEPVSANSLAELLVRIVSRIEPGDNTAMEAAESIQTYLQENLDNIKTDEQIETALKYIVNEHGACLGIPKNLTRQTIAGVSSRLHNPTELR